MSSLESCSGDGQVALDNIYMCSALVICTDHGYTDRGSLVVNDNMGV